MNIMNQRVILVHGDSWEKHYVTMLFNMLTQQFKNYDFARWTEKEYLHNRPQLKGQQKIIFFGRKGEFKNQARSIYNWQFDKYAMKYGWLGNSCVITTYDGDLPFKELPAFANYCKEKSIIYKGIPIPDVDDGAEIANVLANNPNACWRCQYELLIHEFIAHGFSKFMEA